MSNIAYDTILKKTTSFIDTILLPIINNIGEGLEGNIFFYHLTKTYLADFVDKQKNIIIAANQKNVNEILEIGFNSGFSALLFLNSNPNIKITCIDICEHAYTIPCYNKIKEIYGDRINLVIGSSVKTVPKLETLFDLIHIDGSHTKNVAIDDIINSYYISKANAILIMDDYDNPVLKEAWDHYTNVFNFNDLDFCIFENKFQSIKRLNKYNYTNQNIEELLVPCKIPKIIHQIAPSDESKWHPIWKECQETILSQFPEPEYEYRLWNDEEDLENLIKTDFPFFLEIFKNYPKKIQRIDMARYFILLKYGGIYSDMDFYFYKNFYNTLDMSKPNITCSPWVNSEFLQNSLMASPKNCYAFLNIIDEAMRRSTYDSSNLSVSYVSSTTGPELVSAVYYRMESFINPLQKELYNPIGCKASDNENLYNKNTCYCKHFGTGKWE
jgi:mannosyltransferase OCH1-like enzyme